MLMMNVTKAIGVWLHGFHPQARANRARRRARNQMIASRNSLPIPA